MPTKELETLNEWVQEIGASIALSYMKSYLSHE